MKCAITNKVLLAVSVTLLIVWAILGFTDLLIPYFSSHGLALVNYQIKTLLILSVALILLGSINRVLKKIDPSRTSLFILVLFFCSLFGFLFWQRALLLWTQQVTHYSAMNGYIPWSDASSYLFGGQFLAEQGLPLNEWSCRRPGQHLFMGFLTGLWNQNFEMILKSLVILTGMACGLASVAVALQFGVGFGLLFGMGVYLFGAGQFVGLTLSGNIALLFSTLAFMFLILAMQKSARRYLAIALVLLTLSLFSRAGAFFILPFLALIFAFQVRPFKVHWKPLFMGGLVLVGAFLLNKGHRAVVCPPETVANSNFSHTIYGITHGGKGWTYVKKQHPEWLKLSHKEFSDRVYAEAWAKFLAEPEATWAGLSKGTQIYYDYFMVIYSGYPLLEKVLLWVSLLLCIVLSIWGNKTRNKYGRIGLATFLGLFLSAPFIAQDGGARVFAATLPLYLLFILLPLGQFSFRQVDRAKVDGWEKLTITVSALFLLVFFSASVWAQMAETKTPAPTLQCNEGERYVIHRYNPWLSIVLTDRETKEFPYEVDAETFSTYTSRRSHEAKAFLTSLESPATILLGYNLIEDTHIFTYLKTDEPKVTKDGFIEFCTTKKAASHYFWEAHQ